MTKCTLCSRDVEQGRGIIFVTMEGRQLRFCSKKCRIAYRMGRSRNLGWIRKQRKTDKKE